MPEAEADPGHTLILLQETMIMSNEFRAGREELESLQCCLSRDRLSKYLHSRSQAPEQQESLEPVRRQVSISPRLRSGRFRFVQADSTEPVSTGS